MSPADKRDALRMLVDRLPEEALDTARRKLLETMDDFTDPTYERPPPTRVPVTVTLRYPASPSIWAWGNKRGVK